jgi:hypothetical protein
MKIARPMIARTMQTEVAQLTNLKSVLEAAYHCSPTSSRGPRSRADGAGYPAEAAGSVSFARD